MVMNVELSWIINTMHRYCTMHLLQSLLLATIVYCYVEVYYVYMTRGNTLNIIIHLYIPSEVKDKSEPALLHKARWSEK